MRDFSLQMLRQLLSAFLREGYQFVRFDKYWPHRDAVDAQNKVILFRHDVDRFPMTALDSARAEAELGIAGTYFFRVKPNTFDRGIIDSIAKLGHEIGYHYEHLADAGGDYDRSREIFESCLRDLRTIYPVVSVSMHSRAFSKWDSRTFWDRFDLADFGLRGDTYRSVDHNKYMYLADSGRDWNADRNVVWDSVDGTPPPRMNKGTVGLIDTIVTTDQINSVQLLIHPLRWPASARAQIAQHALDKITNMGKTVIKITRRR
jgi:hypothetical protein